MSSTRLPGKVLAEVEGRPMLELMIERVRRVPSLDGIVIATTENDADQPIVDFAERLGVGCWRGSEDDVMRRVLDAATAYDADVIVELTGDCPVIDPAIIETTIAAFQAADVVYAANDLEQTWPIGMNVEVFTTAALKDAERRTSDAEEREHVSPYIYRNPERYPQINVAAPPDETRPGLRLTLDTPEDLIVLCAIFEALGTDPADFSLRDVLVFLDANPQIAAVNANVVHRYVV